MINDDEVANKCKAIERFLQVFDADFNIYWIQRNCDLDLDSEIFEDRQKRITIKWQRYQRQTKKQRLRALK